MFFTPFFKVIPFSKYLSFYLGVILVRSNWASLIVCQVDSFTKLDGVSFQPQGSSLTDNLS